MDAPRTFSVMATVASRRAESPVDVGQARRMAWPELMSIGCWLVALTGVYFVAGKIGLSLAFVHASATAVWPPTGIALAALLLYGYSGWPAVFLGAFLVNVTTARSVGFSLGIGPGNTLQEVLGRWCLHPWGWRSRCVYARAKHLRFRRARGRRRDHRERHRRCREPDSHRICEPGALRRDLADVVAGRHRGSARADASAGPVGHGPVPPAHTT